MPSIINTNLNSLNVQNNMSKSQSSLQTSLTRLSSGLRINGASDDAAGLSISDRMTSQVRGFTQAARNANDAISLAQTAEGSLGAVGNNLQRIRELALQSANSTNSASDRKALNAEAQQLLSEVQRVATSTQFNGLNLLDGTFSSAQFQVGANANQTISVSMSGATTNSLGSYGGQGKSLTQTTGANAGLTAAAWTSASTIAINGTTIGASVATTAPGFTAGSAAAKAAAINAQTSVTGVTATATTSLTPTAAPKAGAGLSAGTLTINGVSVGSIAAATTAVSQGASSASAINAISNQTGVSATYDTSSGKLTLTAADGRDIDIGLGAGANGTAGDAAKVLNATGLVATSGTGYVAPTAGSDTLTIAAAGTATAGANSVNGSSFTINNVKFTLDNTVSTAASKWDATNGQFVIGIADAATGTNDDDAITTAIQGGLALAKQDSNTAAALSSLTVTAPTTTTLLFTDSRLGATATVGRSSTVGAAGAGGIAVGAFGATAAGSDGTLGANKHAVTGGTLNLSASENFTMTQVGTTALADAGLDTLQPGLTALSTVDISTVAGSNKAISVLDQALAQVNAQRAQLGAVQNRFQATIDNLNTSSQNLSAARSRILDADFAAETANLSRGQVLQQAGVAILSQANSLPQQVLSLLR
jgi:flagellin